MLQDPSVRYVYTGGMQDGTPVTDEKRKGRMYGPRFTFTGCLSLSPNSEWVGTTSSVSPIQTFFGETVQDTLNHLFKVDCRSLVCIELDRRMLKMTTDPFDLFTGAESIRRQVA